MFFILSYLENDSRKARNVQHSLLDTAETPLKPENTASTKKTYDSRKNFL
jgi:hypothetical protein